ncbi:MAG: RNA polymerase sigma factor SigZ [Melioribacter sp.]|uniref:RNA polymerase sigma factor SigZ n=1 Tax=Rosettibacter primus TaxID=3111523 RepID=UPI00247E1124|nr:RNA polymerase sigma factor SigZ [Melioribacter sp.]
MTTEELYKKFSKKLKLFIGKRVSNQIEINDILHEVFIKIHNNIVTLKNSEKLESWIYQITRNTIIDYYRSNKTEKEVISFEEDNNAVNKGNEEGVLKFIEENPHKRIAKGLKEFIDQLPGIYKEAIKLIEYEGLTQRQMAERLEISLSNAKSRVQRGRKILKELLMQCCHFDFDKYGTIIDYHEIHCCCCHLHPEQPAKNLHPSK